MRYYFHDINLSYKQVNSEHFKSVEGHALAKKLTTSPARGVFTKFECLALNRVTVDDAVKVYRAFDRYGPNLSIVLPAACEFDGVIKSHVRDLFDFLEFNGYVWHHCAAFSVLINEEAEYTPQLVGSFCAIKCTNHCVDTHDYAVRFGQTAAPLRIVNKLLNQF